MKCEKQMESKKYGIEFFLPLVSFMPPMLYLTLLLIFIMEGRWAGYLPTVSETGTEFPNTSVMFVFFTIISGSIFFEMIFHSLYIFENFKTTKLCKGILLFTVILSSFFFCLISVFPCNISPIMHFTSTFVGFSGIVLFQIVTAYITYRSTSNAKNCVRIFSIIMQILSLLDVALSPKLFCERTNVTISAIGEYGIVTFLPIFFMSFYSEMSKSNRFLVFLSSK